MENRMAQRKTPTKTVVRDNAEEPGVAMVKITVKRPVNAYNMAFRPGLTYRVKQHVLDAIKDAVLTSAPE